MQSITISHDPENHFTVTQGDRFADGLTWAEMVEQVFSLTHPKIANGPYRMQTHAEHDVDEATRALRIAERFLEAERANTGIPS